MERFYWGMNEILKHRESEWTVDTFRDHITAIQLLDFDALNSVDPENLPAAVRVLNRIERIQFYDNLVPDSASR